MRVCRVLLSLFLLLSYSAFAADYKYYKYSVYGQTGHVCSKSVSDARASNVGKCVNQSINSNKVLVSTPDYGTKGGIYCTLYNQGWYDSGGNYREPTPYSNTVYDYASALTKTCPEGQEIVLSGSDSCTVTCDVPPPPTNPCEDKKDQEFDTQYQCGYFNCPSGGIIKQVAPGTSACTTGGGVFVPTGGGGTIYSGGCVATMVIGDESHQFVNADAAGGSVPVYCNGTFKYTGAEAPDGAPDTEGTGGSASGSALPGVSAPGDDGGCPSGTVKGEVQGATVCVADSGSGSGDGGTGTGSGDGGTGGTGGTGSGDGGTGGTGTGGTGDGTGTGEGGTGGTGTGGTGGGGGSSGPCDGSTQTCSAVSSDKCDTLPECSGDPIQCELLLQVWKSNCALMAPASSTDRSKVDAAIDASKDILDGAQEDSSNMLDNLFAGFQASAFTNAGSTAACVPDQSVNILGHSYVLPFSDLCPFFTLFRSLLLIFSYLFATRIIFSAFGGD